MDLDKIIADLNLKKYAITQENLNLSDDEKLVISLYEPENKLIIYGSLAPNRPNHAKIEHIIGKWSKGIVRGKLENGGWGADLGYYGYKKTNAAEDQTIEAFIIFSDELKENYPFLDDFEGADYERMLAVFELENGEVGVGNIYALKE